MDRQRSVRERDLDQAQPPERAQHRPEDASRGASAATGRTASFVRLQQQRAQEERVAAGDAPHLGDERILGGAERVLDQPRDRDKRERPRAQVRGERVVGQHVEHPRDVCAPLRSGRQRQQQRQAVRAPEHVRQPFKRRRVGPLHVVDHERERRAVGQVDGQPVQAVQRAPRRVAVDGRRRGRVEHDRAERRRAGGQTVRARRRPEAGAHPLGVLALDSPARAVSTRSPRSAAASRGASSSRVLPAPASPSIQSAPPRGSRAASSPPAIVRSSASRSRSTGAMVPSPVLRTLVVSDLHLGKTERSDLLRRADLREPLLEALDGVDRLVILGDGLELREAAHRDAIEIAGAVLRRRRRGARARQGADRARRQPRPRARRGLDRRAPAERAGRLPRARAALRAPRPARSRSGSRRPRGRRGCSSPTPASGCATTSTRSTATTPTCTRRSRRSSASPPARWRATSPSCPRTARRADDYEAVLTPLYAWLHALTQRADHTLVSGRRRRVVAHLRGADRRRHSARARSRSSTGYRAAVAALNRAGLGPLQASLSPTRAAARLPDAASAR